jgi:intracellular multiplication protein IcmL
LDGVVFDLPDPQPWGDPEPGPWEEYGDGFVIGDSDPSLPGDRIEAEPQAEAEDEPEAEPETEAEDGTQAWAETGPETEAENEPETEPQAGEGDPPDAGKDDAGEDDAQVEDPEVDDPGKDPQSDHGEDPIDAPAGDTAGPLPAAPAVDGEGRGVEVVIESRDWYLGQNRRLFKVLSYALPILLLSLALNFWQVAKRPEPRYFAVTRDLRVMDMPPLSEPAIESRSLGNWAGDVVVRALSLNFLTWRQTLSDLRGEFDPAGFESFLGSLKEGGHLEKIEKERLSLSSLISGAPVVTGSGLRGGVMTWRLEMPLTLSYESSSGVVASQRLLAEVVVERVKPSLNPKGVVIKQIVLTAAGQPGSG